MAVGSRSSRCRGYFTAPWIDGSRGDLLFSDEWIYPKEDSYVQALEDKLTASRETALRRLIGSFNRKPMSAFVLERREVLIRGFAGILEREDASSVELALACRVLGLLALAMAEDPLGLDSLIKQTSSLLRHQAHGECSRPACAALGAMAVLAVAGMHTGDLDIEAEDVSLLDWLWSIILRNKGGADEEDGASISAAALAAWTILLTTLAPHRVAHHGQQRGPHLISLTQPPECTTTSHALALLAEASPPDASELDADPSSDLPAAPELQSTEYMLLHGAGKVLIRTWSQTVQFSFLRDYLGAGFAYHMQHSRLLHHLFDFVPKERTQELSIPPPYDSCEELEGPVPMRKTRAACRRANELVERAQTRVRNRGRSRKQESFFIGED